MYTISYAVLCLIALADDKNRTVTRYRARTDTTLRNGHERRMTTHDDDGDIYDLFFFILFLTATTPPPSSSAIRKRISPHVYETSVFGRKGTIYTPGYHTRKVQIHE